MPEDIEDAIRRTLHDKGLGIREEHLQRNTFPSPAATARRRSRHRLSIVIAAATVVAVCLTIFTLTATRDDSGRDAPAGPVLPPVSTGTPTVETDLPTATEQQWGVEDIEGINWMLASVTEDGITTQVPEEEQVYLSIVKADLIRGSTRITFTDTCNRRGGEIIEAGSTFKITSLGTTLAACPVTGPGAVAPRVVNAVLSSHGYISVVEVSQNSMTLALGSNSLTYRRADRTTEATSQETTETTTTASFTTIPMPTSDFDLDSTVAQTVMDAILAGRLVLTSTGCVALTSGANGEPRVIVWPTGFTARLVDGSLVVLDQDGTVVAREGDRISVRGGSGFAGPGGYPLGQRCLERNGTIEIFQGELTVISAAPTTG
ncbi:META domain-containing protein [Nakamurella silvestris]|nr:META domain-containing protein [Nakamurella silvestris]